MNRVLVMLLGVLLLFGCLGVEKKGNESEQKEINKSSEGSGSEEELNELSNELNELEKMDNELNELLNESIDLNIS